MSTVGNIIREVSIQLNDQRPARVYTRWTRDMLVGYLSDAVAEVSGIRPDLFTIRVEVPLVAGRLQEIPAQYSSLVRIEQSDGSPVYQADMELMKGYTGVSPDTTTYLTDVNGNVTYRAWSFSVDPNNTKVYYVSPMVPPGGQWTAIASVVKEPVEYSVTRLNEVVELDSSIINCAKDYMLGRAYEIDSESAESRGNSVKHMTQFYQYFNIKYKAESAFRSGYYMGNTKQGSGRPEQGNG